MQKIMYAYAKELLENTKKVIRGETKYFCAPSRERL